MTYRYDDIHPYGVAMLMAPAPFQQLMPWHYPLRQPRPNPSWSRPSWLNNPIVGKWERAPTQDNQSFRRVINMISRGATDDDYNRAWKRYKWTEYMVIKPPKVESRPILGFWPNDLEEVTSPHNNSLVIQVTLANFDLAQIFVDVGRSINVLFWIAME